MKQLIFKYILMVCVSSNAIIFSSDKHIGPIDTFVLRKDTLNCTKSISKYFTDYANPENHFLQKEPIFITINGALLPIDMPTNIKPFIVILHDAQHIIDQQPDIFCLKNIKNKISFISQNKSNSTIHTKLADLIVPIDHCTYVKNNKSSIDIVSIFFDMEILSRCIPRLQINAKKRALDVITQKKHQEPLSIPRNNSDSLKKQVTEKDQSAVRRANRRYLGGSISSDEENPQVVHVSAPDYNFWNDAAAD